MRRLLVAAGVFFALVPSSSAMRWLGDPGADTTPPVITVPSPAPAEATSSAGASVSYTEPTATDDVDPPTPPVSCDHHSGDIFPLGQTTVTCTATDTAGNIATATFTVTVQDTTPPVLSAMPGPISDTTDNPAGKSEGFQQPTATDIADPSPTVVCDHSNPGNFPIGTTPVHCQAKDNSGNASAVGSFDVTITLVDHTAPSLSLPTSFSVDTENPGGTAVSYVATASDNIDPAPTVQCSPASGANFPLGPTTVNCTAVDHASPPNQATGSFTITVNLVDHTPPVLSGVPTNKTVEANGPTGSVVNYPTPTAVDALDGPIGAVSCTPVSGTTFPLGTTPVNCNASDSHGNVGHATFSITVADTTPPNLIVPVARSVHATTPTGIPDTVSGIVSFLSAASASDLVDPNPVVTNNAPSFLPVGNLTITFGARDASGNATFKDVTLIVLPQPPPGTPPLPIPPPPTAPAEVTNVKVTSLDGAARIQWNAGGRQVMVTRSSSSTRSLSAIGDEVVVYKGTGSSYVDRGLQNGVEYRYVVAAVDAAGNHSAGVAAVIVPRRNLLKSPKDGARLRKAPKLTWALDSEAAYYNAQLLLNGKKILSVWPTSPAFALKKTWKYEGRKYTLAPGLYTWFVWPGYGARSAVDYGELMGSRTFRIVR